MTSKLYSGTHLGIVAAAFLLACLPKAVSATADLALTVQNSPAPVVVGNSLTLTYSIFNKGPDAATGIILSNPLPPSLIYTSVLVTNGAYTYSNGLFTYTLESLQPASSVTATLVVTPMSTEIISNRTSVIANEIDPWLLDNINQYGLIQVLSVAPGARMGLRRQYHTATLLEDGRVLITGGDIWQLPDRVTATAELYDPRLEIFTPASEMTVPRLWHTATRLPDGRVVVAGGLADYFITATPTIDLYDPAKNEFQGTHPMSVVRARHTATLLPDGRVLIAGGTAGETTVETYDYRTGTVSAVGDLLIPRSGHIAALLPDGKVLFVGGSTNLPSAEIFDPATGMSVPAGGISKNKVSDVGLSLADGRVLLMNQTASEIYDSEADRFSPSGTPASWQSSPSLVSLNDGRVLVTGGNTWSGYTQTAQIYDPVLGLFSPAAPMTEPRMNHTATRLLDGRVLLAGGFNAVPLDTSEIYTVILDRDQDGMDDAWELKYGLDPTDRRDAIQDADGDGFSNLQEYLAGTNPRDPQSLLRIETIQVNSNLCRIRFTSVPGKHYRLERTTDYSGQNWISVSNNIAGTGAILEVFDPVVDRTKGYWYRVAVLR